MRIIGGSAKGRVLLSPSDTRVRPTSDRAREGLFSSLESTFGSIEGLNFLDLFAGSGAVGVEALSRGAKTVHAVEAEADVASLAQSNFEMVKNPAGTFKTFNTRAQRYLESGAAMLKNENKFDIIFMDPPYDLSNQEVSEILTTIAALNLLDHRGIIAVERDRKSDSFIWPEPLQEEKVRSYGQGSIYYGGYSASVLP